MKKKLRLDSSQIIPLSFLAAIAVGTLLLLLPISNVSGRGDFMTSLFTSTTSVCVTGLVTVDTFAHWTAFGKAVILVLIQLGGLGIVTVTSSLLIFFNRKLTLGDRLLIQDTFNLASVRGLGAFLRKVLIFTFVSEGIGAVLYLPVFIRDFGVGKGIWQAVFTSVSAFCNAGIDVMGPDSLARYAHSPLVLITTMLLIVTGGLGFVVWFDLFGRDRKRLGEHTKTVIAVTLSLILIGAAVIFVSERNNPQTLGNMSVGGKILNSLFESVTFRTAGFSTFPQAGLGPGSVLLGSALMFIGGSPVGTAGGIKTVVLAIVAANALSFIRGRNDTVLFKRRVSTAVIRKSTAIFSVSLAAALLITLALILTEGLSLSDGLFESFSAIGTVGLSRGVTPSLGTAGQLIIILGMYLGRIGPISMAIFFSGDDSANRVKVAEGTFFAG